MITAITMKQRQRDMREAEMELEKYKSETDQLQAKLIEAEKILVIYSLNLFMQYLFTYVHAFCINLYDSILITTGTLPISS